MRRAQVEEVQGCNVVCKALNDAVLGGLLTVIHSEKNDAGMSDLQVVLSDACQCQSRSF